MNDQLYAFPASCEQTLRALARYPSRTAFAWPGGSISYQGATDLIGRIQNIFMRLDLEPGARVAFLTANRADTWCAGVAAQLARLAITWLHPMGSLDDQLFQLEDSEAQMLVVDTGAFHDRGGALAARANGVKTVFTTGPAGYGIDLLQAIEQAGHATARSFAHSDDIATLNYTGGTTGKSKGAMRTHREYGGFASAILADFEIPDGARYLTADLDLFQDEDVFSRFQLVPNRTGLDGAPFANDPAPRDGKGGPPVGEAALAGTDLSALGGWCARPFRVHDFLLGRLNMATYLRREMILRGDNDLFNNWTFETIATYATRKNGDKFVGLTKQTPKEDYYLPVIPLPDDNFGVAPPAWPVDALTRDELARLQQQIDVRAKAILGKLQADDLPGFAGWLLDLVAGGGLSSTIAGDVISAFTQSLTSRNLLSPVAQDPVAVAQESGGLSVAG